MLQIQNELSLSSTTSVVMIVLGAIALFLFYLLVKPSRRGRKRREKALPMPPTSTPEWKKVEPLLPIPAATGGAYPCWLVLDLQTTGLSTERGAEDLIVEATWLLLDKAFQLIRKHTVRVRQSYSGSEEAKAVHQISEEQLLHLGVSEKEMVTQLMQDVTPGITLVMHNAKFDLAILRGTVERVAPEMLSRLDECTTFCTMTFLPLEKYPSLAQLTHTITPFTEAQFRSLRPISYRNAYFTRFCLVALLYNEAEEGSLPSASTSSGR